MWYINYNGQQYGPMDKSQLSAYGLTPESYVWRSGMAQWQQARYVPELRDVLYQELRHSTPAIHVRPTFMNPLIKIV